MIFSTVSFLFYFLPIFLLAYAVLPFRNATVLLFSLLFYIWGEGIFVLVLLFSVVINYFSGKLIDRSDNGIIRRRYLISGIIANIVLLFYFKYFGFLLLDVLNLKGISPDSIPHLPLGISFFTFQSISYLMDVYRRDAKCAQSIWDLALYIMMFPQLIAGPIVRYARVARQIRRRVIHYSFVRHGLWFFSVGLSQKVLIANNMAVVADHIYALPVAELSTNSAWLGTLAYTLQIYFDFSGYSNMAIGLGLILGFKFPRNFNYPYISQSITEFWRRWHMSLSSWFRDYVYIPMGGNRKGNFATYRNLFVVFLLCGLWHGAAWTFIIWGLFHGLVLILERVGISQILEVMPRPIRHGYALLLILIGWVIFRAENLDQAWAFLAQMFGILDDGQRAVPITELINNQQIFFILVGIIASTPLMRIVTKLFAIHSDHEVVNRSNHFTLIQHIGLFATVGLLLFFSATYVSSGTYNPFLYFRF